MPTYDYICRACGHGFELFQRITARAKRTCPECGKRRLERLIGPGAGVIFKGSGFYQTDYRSETYKKAAEAETAKPSDAEKKKDTTPKSETDGAASTVPTETKKKTRKKHARKDADA